MKPSGEDAVASLPVENVALARIDPVDETLRITTAEDSDDLCRSIATLGLLTAPILQAAAGGAYRVVSGFRRVAACRRLGRALIPARLLGPEADPSLVVRLAIADNSGQRALNLIEQSRAIGLMRSVLPPNQDLGQALGSLGISLNSALAGKIGLLAGLAGVIQEGVLAGNLSLAMALELGGMPAGEGRLLAELFAELKPSLNKQREIVTLASEIALRDGVDLAALFSSQPLAAMRNAPEMDRNQKLRQIRQILHRMRYPELSRFEGRVAQALGRIRLGPGLSLTPPRHFESPTWTATLAFDSRAALGAAHRALGRLMADPAFKRILEKRDL
ncbi:MAG TPA: ParB/RepB/Spo0J family partition protein [Desulfobacterales bacterium]|nr:ParB/RepB/Spo0J family partition protein [Desulfobacterales bacterium]